MNERQVRKTRMEMLLESQRMKREQEERKWTLALILENHPFLREGVIFFSHEKTEKIWERFYSDFPFTFWGRIDWVQVTGKVSVSSVSEIRKVLKQNGIGMTEDAFFLSGQWGIPAFQVKWD